MQRPNVSQSLPALTHSSSQFNTTSDSYIRSCVLVKRHVPKDNMASNFIQVNTVSFIITVHVTWFFLCSSHTRCKITVLVLILILKAVFHSANMISTLSSKFAYSVQNFVRNCFRSGFYSFRKCVLVHCNTSFTSWRLKDAVTCLRTVLYFVESPKPARKRWDWH